MKIFFVCYFQFHSLQLTLSGWVCLGVGRSYKGALVDGKWGSYVE